MARKRTYFGPATAKASNRELANHALKRVMKQLEFKKHEDFYASTLHEWLKESTLKAKPHCYICGQTAKFIHFMRTDIRVFTGRDSKHIATLCWPCLQHALNNPNGVHRSLAETNQIIRDRIKPPVPEQPGHTAEDSQGQPSADSERPRASSPMTAI